MPIITKDTLILASTSPIRHDLLTAAGLTFDALAPDFDEEQAKPHIKNRTPLEQALFLASGKACSVSAKHPNAFVIGADQVCALEKHIFSKPRNATRATSQLRMMSGKTHGQNCACVIAYSGKVIWQHAETAHLTMRQLTDDEIMQYVALDEPFWACGSYKFESYGKHLFAAVGGSYDTIKGLPMIPLLRTLYERDLIALVG